MDIGKLKKEGLLTITVSLVVTVIALLLSDGYNPQGGLLYSLTYEMYLMRLAVGCEEPLAWSQNVSCDDGFAMTVQTKYVISALALLLVYGVGQYLEFFPSLKFWGQRNHDE